MRYTIIPKEISSTEVINNNYSLSPSQYKRVLIPNSNFIFVKDFLSRPLKRSDLGTEIGSNNYIEKSNKYFFRTKGLQSHSYLPDINKESLTPMNPKSFVDHKLKAGDLIISKDSNIGETIILDKDYPDWMLSGALYRLPVKKWKYYLFAFLKHESFREQLDFMVPKSATIRHAKKMFLDCKVPLPFNNSEVVITYIEEMVKAIIEVEKEIHRKHFEIFELIDNEIRQNQTNSIFEYKFPTLSELKVAGRFDTNLFTEKFKNYEFIIKNYINNFSSITELDFDISRGQNLQISTIGKSIYSEKYYPTFYTLMLPKHLSQYGTIDNVEYLGNKKNLKTLNKGDLIFGAEGFEKGRSIVILEEKTKTITNIHGITLHQRQGNVKLSIFIKCFLDYLRNIGLIDLYAVGGNGGSLAMKYWEIIPFPNFPEQKQEKIINLYSSNNMVLDKESLYLNNFVTEIIKFNSQAGIHELDKAMRIIKSRIDEVVDEIINGHPVNISFDFLQSL